MRICQHIQAIIRHNTTLWSMMTWLQIGQQKAIWVQLEEYGQGLIGQLKGGNLNECHMNSSNHTLRDITNE